MNLLLIRMRIIFNVRHRYTNRLQVRDKLPASLTKLVLEAKATIKEHLHLVKISMLAVVAII